MRRVVLVVSWVGLLALLLGCEQTPAVNEVSEFQDDMIIIELFNEQVADSWQIVSPEPDLQVDLTAVDFVADGEVSIALLNAGNSNTLTLTADPSPDQSYPNENMLGLRFDLNAGFRTLSINDIMIGFVGDEGNELSFPLATFISPTTLPANSWQTIEVRIDQLEMPLPDNFIAGIFLHTPASHTIFLDNIQLLVRRDDTPPTIVGVTQLNDTSLAVAFSEPMNPFAVNKRNNYLVNGNIPRQALYSLEEREVILVTSRSLAEGNEIVVDVSGVGDAGIPANPLAGETSFTLQSKTFVESTIPVPVPETAPTVIIKVDPYRDTHPISPYIYGMANADQEYADSLNIGMARWGGNANSRYNWQLGNAWNASRDWEYRNTTYELGGNVADDTILENDAIGVPTLLTIPTLGWVAKDTESCAFPMPDGSCGNAGNGTCDNPTTIADPTATSIESPPEFMVEWVEYLGTLGVDLPFFVLGNEPGLWGVTHYDVHPDCTTQEEIYEKYAAYASPIKQVAPDTQLAGPASCCWWFYWNTMATSVWEQVNGDRFLPWFLSQAAQHEAETDERILDILDVHYYPANVYNDDTSADMAAMRLRSTRALWDYDYIDESWIDEAIYLLPRLKTLIAENYPGTKVGIGEWNFGADDTMNGALAIADVLGIYGQQGVYYAAYWEYPEWESPGYYAFKMFTDFDNAGTSFAPFSVYAHSTNVDQVASYAARDPKSGDVHLMLINKQPADSAEARIDLTSFAPENAGTFYQYTTTHDTIQQGNITVDENFQMSLPPYSITLIVMEDKDK